MKKNITKGNIGPIAKTFNWLTFAVLVLFSISLMVPLVWALVTSFKDAVEYSLNPFWLPKVWTLDNYRALKNVFFARVFIDGVGNVKFGTGIMTVYTLILAVARPLLSTFFTTLAAYALSKHKLWGGKFLFNLGIVIMLIPIVGSFPSQMKVYRDLGIYDNMFMLIIINGGSFYGLTFLMLYAAFKRIPNEYSEAAFIDGANRMQVLLKIAFPMILSTAAIFFFTGFLGAWNDYQTSLIWLPSKPTLAYGLYLFQNQSMRGGSSSGQPTGTVPQVLSGFLIVMIPTMLLYLSIQHILISKLQIGGLKG